ncbi:MAG: aminotransferase class I/II-fold pyridoxal phosphate-dependent enzyme [bacterium]|nr:aminotransferase class I/II-fold pyridoxal phosphate-dependent enzyme [bacterium]
MRGFKPISISLSPNVEKDDIQVVFDLLKKPFIWKNGETIENLENEFKKYLNIKNVFSFNSGRSAFLAILKSLNLGQGSEVLIQSFTCNAAVNPIIWAGYKPIYVDVDENDFNINVGDLNSKITPKTKAIVVQHTFGIPAKIEEILKICKEKNLILIEDCAHCLGAEYQGKKLGTFGKAAFFSFSRDKVISSIYGGIAVINDEILAENLKKYHESLDFPSNAWIFQQLIHPLVLNYLILPIYGFLSLGKLLLIVFQNLNILSKAVHWKEKIGQMPPYFPKKLPNALAVLALNQFKKLDKFNKHREKIAEIYFQELQGSGFILPEKKSGQIFLRFALKHPNAHKIIKMAWAKNILLGDWYTAPIAPDDTKPEKLCYSKNNCETAEKLSKITFNLPTHINISEETTKSIIQFIKKYD